MSLDFDLDDAQRAMADAVATLCRAREAEVRAPGLPLGLWRDLAELGALGVATPEGGGGALDAVAVMEALGAVGFPGPLAATFVAARLLPAPEREAVVSGAAIASVGAPPLLPCGAIARIFIELEGARAWRVRPAGRVEPVDTLAGEPWGRASLVRETELPGAADARALGDVAAAAYLAAAGQALVDAAAEHARTRRQFGRTIGEFQAVAHPLADCAIRLAASRTLARVAAAALETAAAARLGSDRDASRAREDAAAARLSAEAAAVRAAEVCTQAFGATGVLREGPAWPLARRIRQAASSPPSAAAARETVLAGLGFDAERSAA